MTATADVMPNPTAEQIESQTLCLGLITFMRAGRIRSDRINDKVPVVRVDVGAHSTYGLPHHLDGLRELAFELCDSGDVDDMMDEDNHTMRMMKRWYVEIKQHQVDGCNALTNN